MSQTPIESSSHVCRFSGGFAYIDRKAPTMVLETTGVNGLAITTPKPAAQVFPTATQSELQNEFSMWTDNKQAFHVDINCGCQRWRGSKTACAVGVALSRCGFTRTQRRRIFSLVRTNA